MRTNKMLWILTIILLNIVKLTEQVAYSCNTTATCGCSTSSTATLNRIVGGENAASATWGWAVYLSIGSGYLCGGSIISNTWILTAAHCVNGFRASQIRVYAGSIYRGSYTQTSVASCNVVHPNYDSSTYVYDIALIKLASPFSMSDSQISQICLPSVSSATLLAGEWPLVGTNVIAVGWGRLSESSSSLPTTLQQVTVQTVAFNDSTCTPSMKNWRVQFCAGISGGGKDTCQGDSGGPLMLFMSNVWVLVGLTSNGIGCARATNAGVYTRVAAFQDWISSTVNAERCDSTSMYKLSSSLLLFFSVSSLFFKHI